MMNDEQGGAQKNFSTTKMVRTAASFALVLAIGFVGGLTVNAEAGSKMLSSVPLIGDKIPATPDPNADFTEFWKAWNILQTRFVQTHASSTLPDLDKKMYGAIAGMTSSYGDPYTVFMPPEESKRFQENIAGSFSGVGMEIGVNPDGILTVIAPLKGTPEEKAGIRAGDLILTIDGKSTDGLSTDAAVKLIRGEKGTTVNFKMVREGKVREVSVVRDTIAVPNIDASYDKDSGVYTIALYEFTENSGKQFSDALASFRASGSSKLIIDLRGNPGGYLEQAVDIASHFLPKGAVVVTEDYKGKQQNLVHRSRGTMDVDKSVKVVILIDQGSASASEILAGALQDEKVATLVGTRSFGKGSVQELIDIGEGSLKVTIARWLTPAGRSISDGGLTADIKVEYTDADREAKKDPQKERAVEFLRTGK